VGREFARMAWLLSAGYGGIAKALFELPQIAMVLGDAKGRSRAQETIRDRSWERFCLY
jgi:NAD/NADP transhydrogenase beta subunit